MRNLKFSSSTPLSALLALLIPISAFSSDPAPDYLTALRIADQHVKRVKALEASHASALSAGIIKRLYGRYYQVGDAWRVAAIQLQPNMSPHLTKEGDAYRQGPVGIFRYEVVEVKTGTQPSVVLRVTQESAFGKKPIDPRISSLILEISNSLKQQSKSYLTKNIARSARSERMSRLEFFPLDLPYVLTAEEERVEASPELPSSLAAVARSAKFQLDRSKSLKFEQADPFGRPSDFIWEQGKPWPSYLKNPQGVAILLDVEGAES